VDVCLIVRNGRLDGRRALLGHLHQEAEHGQGEVALGVVQVLDHTLGPLEGLLVAGTCR
jgi:hypothetical protein